MPELVEEALLDAQAVAKWLSLPIRAIYVMAEDGRLPHYKIDRRLRFSRDQIETFLATRRVEP